MKRILATAAIAATLALAAPARAENVTITTTVAPVCSFSIGAALALPAYDPITKASVFADHPFSIQCTMAELPKVTLGAGFAGLLKKNPTDTTPLTYTLAQPGGAVGSWTAGGVWNAPPADGSVQPYNLRAQVTAGQDVPAGTYTETIVLTLSL
jgi:spore coat protein U-like protein